MLWLQYLPATKAICLITCEHGSRAIFYVASPLFLHRIVPVNMIWSDCVYTNLKDARQQADNSTMHILYVSDDVVTPESSLLFTWTEKILPSYLSVQPYITRDYMSILWQTSHLGANYWKSDRAGQDNGRFFQLLVLHVPRPTLDGVKEIVWASVGASFG